MLKLLVILMLVSSIIGEVSVNIGVNVDDEEKEHNESKIQWASCKGKPKIQCLILGGSCIAKDDPRCYGRRVPAGCTGRCECCIPGCPENQEFFSPPGSKQCFKIFRDINRNWDGANEKCGKEGLIPAHPFDPDTLRQYIVTRFGTVNVWLYARGNGQYIVWQDNSAKITSDNPLWSSKPSQHYNPATTQCLQLRANALDWKDYPGEPYENVPCNEGRFYYTLCQWNYGRIIM